MKDIEDFCKNLTSLAETDFKLFHVNVKTYVSNGYLAKVVHEQIYNWMHRFPSGELESMDEVWTYIERESHSIDMLDLDLELVYPSKVYDTMKEVLMATLRYILNKKLSKHLYNKYDTFTKR